MSRIDKIIELLRSFNGAYEKEAQYLERLKEPTPAMVYASCKVAYGPGYTHERVCEQDIVAAESELEAMLQAAEEGL